MSPLDAAGFAAARRRFEELADLDPAARATALAALAAGEPELATAVAALLAADAAAGEGFLGGGIGAFAPELVSEALATGDSGGPQAGDRVGPYRLRVLLGRGGMGEVWETERADGQFEQTVALKLLKRGMDSDEVLARFRRERQILARLEHPNIARLLDGGIAPDGRPYFVLERVEGREITAWCDEQVCGVEARLRLIIAAADAVAAAHRSLVIHRDLKPSNILVDRSGQVKLLDFGIAKLLSGEDGTPADRTRLEERALTPAYAAPEQIRGEPVTTATDVYALGVVLYELVTGRLPHDRASGSVRVLVDQVEREAPTRPSRIAADAGEPRKARALAGDLDTIVLKALAREPARRYASATALADDLRRHLEGRPVRARPDSRLYRAQKFFARHRVAVIGGVLTLLALGAGLSTALWQARRAAANGQRAERVKEFLIGLFEVADPEHSGGEVPVRELIDQAGKRLEIELANEPLIRADLLEAVARIDRSLGLLDPASELAEKALAIRTVELPQGDAAVASARATLGSIRLDQGKLDAALAELEQALAQLEATEPPESFLLARTRSDFGNALFQKGRVEEAERAERKVWEVYGAALGADNLQTALHLRNLGVVLDELDRQQEAEEALRTSQKVIERLLGADHRSAAEGYVNLAVLLERRGKLAEVEDLLKRGLAIHRDKLGGSHPSTGRSIQLYAVFLKNRDRLDESEELYREARALFAAINPRSFEVGKCDNGLAIIAGKRGDHGAAEKLLAGVTDLFREQLGEAHPFVWQVQGNQAREIAAQGRLAEAAAIQRQVVTRLETITGPESHETADALSSLASSLEALGQKAEAATLAARAAAIEARILAGPERAR